MTYKNQTLKGVSEESEWEIEIKRVRHMCSECSINFPNGIRTAVCLALM